MIKTLTRLLFESFGYKIQKISTYRKENIPPEFSDTEIKWFEFVRSKKLSLCSNERLFTTIKACAYAVQHQIPGDFVECGVWRGGNSIIAAGVFSDYGADKRIHLFDTFSGMTEPTDIDSVTSSGESARSTFYELQNAGNKKWCYASLEDVRNNFKIADLLTDKVVFHQGDVKDTLAVEAELPKKISVLRLDTDWYESTKIELEVLFPRLAEYGILLIDDYGHWDGARKAVEEYFNDAKHPIFLQYNDYTGRSAVKTSRV